jgi:hypothetical protein
MKSNPSPLPHFGYTAKVALLFTLTCFLLTAASIFLDYQLFLQKKILMAGARHGIGS